MRLHGRSVDMGCIFMQNTPRFMQTQLPKPSSSSDSSQHQLARRAAILRILKESSVHKQEELVQILRREGFEATQSSVSRDLRELGVAKAGDHYILPSGAGGLREGPFAALAGFVIDIRTAGASLTVLKTTTGTAQSVAVAIDQAGWPEVVGTLSGDDAIFIATENEAAQRQLTDRLRTTFRL